MAERLSWFPRALASRLGLLVALVSVVALYTAWRLGRGYLFERRSIRGRIAVHDLSGERRVFPGLLEASVLVDGVSVRGWFAPGINRAAVLLVHGTGSDRTSLRSEMRYLNRAGFSVLSFDQPGHGDSGGEVSFSGINRRAIAEVTRFLRARPEVDPERLGALGVSYGGYDLLHSVAETRFRALAVAGTPADLKAQSIAEYPRFLERAGAYVAMSQFGVPLEERPLSQVVSQMTPRPLLVIWGAHDHAVPRHVVEPIFESAPGPKRWVSLPNSSHGDYAAADGPRYEAELVEFFRESLL
jgi:uncharacterized protein